MRILATLLCMVLLSMALLGVQTAPNLARASEIWEKAIAAKGGRARIDAISNFLVVQRTKKNGDPMYLHLYFVNSSRSWYWEDAGGVFGRFLTVNDGTGNWQAYTGIGGRNGQSGLQWYPASDDDQREWIQTQALFLLETQSYKPKLLGLKSERIGRQEFHVVTVDGSVTVRGRRDRLDYFIDKETFLVRRVRPDYEYPPFGLTVLVPWDLTDYKLVDGLMMPTRGKAGETYELEFGVNVEYDPRIFQGPPALEDGPYGWQPKKK